MILLTLFLVPIVIAVLSFIILKGITIKEFLIQIAAQIVLFGIIAAFLHYSNLNYTEILNGKVTDKKREKVSCRHSYKCFCYTSCSGSGKSRSCTTHCQTCYDHSYDIDWDVHTNLDNIYSISTLDRQGLREPPRWTEVKINDPVARTHTYKNYIKASGSTLFQKKGLLEKYKEVLPNYPNNIYDIYKLNRIVKVIYKLKDLNKWNKYLSAINSRIGVAKQCNAILVLSQYLSREFKAALEQHWLGGNKNDAILIVNMNQDNKIDWVDVIALTKTSLFQHELTDDILFLNKFNIKKVLDLFEKNIMKNYKRKEMKDFEYLSSTITPSTTQFVVSLIISLVISIGLTIFFEIEDVA